MLTFILILLLAISFGYFATQNTQQIIISFAGYSFPKVPLYVVIGLTLLLGLGFSWILSLIKSLFTSLKMRGKDQAIKSANRNINDLSKKIDQLELENAKLKGQLDKAPAGPLLEKS